MDLLVSSEGDADPYERIGSAAHYAAYKHCFEIDQAVKGAGGAQSPGWCLWKDWEVGLHFP